MHHFCTIASSDYLPLAQALLTSLRRQSASVTLHVLVTDDNHRLTEQEGLYQYSVADLQGIKFLTEVIYQYGFNNNYLRWALKPIFLSWLLERHGRVIYIDNDIAFFAPFDFLFDELQKASILLTPHWFCQRPYPHPENFETNFRIGLFNAGFVGASQAGIPFLQWWAEVCLYRMERAEDEGFYDDQRFLDMAPVLDEKAAILRHLGCNLGSWNMHQNRRIKTANGVLINGQYPVVFIHFNHETIKHILNGNDGMLRPHLDAYEGDIAATGHRLEEFVRPLPEWKKVGPFRALMQRTRIRTNIKRWLFRLSQKL